MSLQAVASSLLLRNATLIDGTGADPRPGPRPGPSVLVEDGVRVFDLAELLDQSIAFSRPSTNGGSPRAPEAERLTASGPV